MSSKGFASRVPTAGRRRSHLAILQGDEKAVTMRLHCQPSANFLCFAFEHGTMTRFKSTPRRVKTNHTIIIHNSSRETRAEARCFHSGLIIFCGQVGGDGVSPSLRSAKGFASRMSTAGRRRSQLAYPTLAVAPSWVLNLVKMFGDFGEVRNFAPDFNGIRFKVRKIIRRDGG